MAGVPTTPRKKDGSIDEIIHQLNEDYGLGIEIPDGSLTPHMRKELAKQSETYGRWDAICRAVQFLYYQRDDSLELALRAFFNEAKAASQEWVPKPRADYDTLPRSTVPPKAKTAGQRWQMETLLLETLTQFKPTRGPGLLSKLDGNGKPAGRPVNTRNPIAPAATEPLRQHRSILDDEASPQKWDQDSHGAKRSLYDNNGHSNKRPRGRQQPYSAHAPVEPIAIALDGIPAKRRAERSPLKSTRENPIFINDEESFDVSVVSSSKHSIESSVFTQCEDPWTSQSTAPSPDKRQPQASTAQRHRQITPTPRQTFTQHSVLQEQRQTRGASSRVYHAQDHRAGDVDEITWSDDSIVVDEPTPSRMPIPRAIPPSTLASSPSTASTFSSFPGTAIMSTPPKNSPPTTNLTPIEERLQDIWPKFPRWLHEAPLAVAWEVTRLCLHCHVDLEDSSLQYNRSWANARNVMEIWRSLYELDVFRGKPFPEKPSTEAFTAALFGNFESKGNAVVLSANLDYNPDKAGPLFLVDMKPLRLEQGCRLTRRFGPDRFFEILIPSPTGLGAPSIVKDGGVEPVIDWLTNKRHSIVGRQWRAFYTKDAGYRKPAREYRLGPDNPKPTFKDRVHFFAESGHNFRPVVVKTRTVVPAYEPYNQRTEFSVSQLLHWLLQVPDNESQPHLKLFSRIQLGLSKTFPVVVLEPHQIIHHQEDILSPIGKVMNDGIGRMSRSVARKVRDALGLADIPSAVQGRLGSAKGMWLMDVADMGDEDWIETWPSQRKWICDFADKYQRTLEIRSVATELKSAGLNLQLLPVLEDRAKDKKLMREAIGTRLTNDLRRQFDSQKSALNRPIEFRQWINENNSNRSDRVTHGYVPFLAGLPDNKEETLNFLLNSGFDPKKQKFIQEMAWELQKQRCETLKTKLNIRVGKSAYVYMVVDFWGVLEENEIHLGFSNKFRDEYSGDEGGGESFTLLADRDVLVARSPAHFVSDVQRVRAVFKSELHALKDVIVFSAKGNIPLADKLSGGDYDGDMAWVCWDPDIVDSFVNAEVPSAPDLSRYLSKDKTKFEDLKSEIVLSSQSGIDLAAAARDEAIYKMINKSFHFAMQPNFLGICTNYKERLCYHNNSVSNNAAVILSSLVGNLVDQSKQGIIFNTPAWEQLRKERLGLRGVHLEDPAYKGDIWVGPGEPRHIIDYLKFTIAKPAIDRELEAFHKAMQKGRAKAGVSQGEEDLESANHWDPDLVVYYEGFKAITQGSRSCSALLKSLENIIGQVCVEWQRIHAGSSDLSFPAKVNQVYEKWRAIESKVLGGTNRVDSKIAKLLSQPYLCGVGKSGTDGSGTAVDASSELSYFGLLKASTAFKLYYNRNPRFVWQMAGRGLATIKAQVVSSRGGDSLAARWTGGQVGGPGDGVPVLVTPLMYAGMMPDKKFVRQYVARLDGDGAASDYYDLGPDRDLEDLMRDLDDDGFPQATFTSDY